MTRRISLEEFGRPTSNTQQARRISLEEFASPAQAPIAQEAGFIENVGQDLQQRGQDVAETFSDLQSRKQTVPEATLDLLSTGAGAVSDIATQGVVSGFKSLPQPIQQAAGAVGDVAGQAFGAILNTEVGKAGLAALQQGAKFYAQFKEENPRAAKNLENVVNVGAFITPIKGQSAASATLNIPVDIATAAVKAVPKALDVTKAGVGAITGGLSNFSRKTLNKVIKINPAAAEAFSEAGIKQSLALISDSPAVKLYDRFLSKFPGAAGVMKRNTDEILNTIEADIKSIGGSKTATLQESGAVIQDGVKKFGERFQQSAGYLYTRLNRKIPDNEQVEVSNTLELLKDQQFTNEVFGKEAIATIGAIKASADVPKGARAGVTFGKIGTVPYFELRKFRTLVGDKQANSLLIAGEDKASLARLYGAISKDLEIIAQKKGATKEFKKADGFYAAYIENIQKHLDKVISKDAPEQVFQAAISGTKLGGTRIKQVMRSLNKEEREIVRGTVINRLGKAAPGQQDATGELFSPQKFLTNWSATSPEAKAAIFGADTARRKSLDNIAKVSERIKGVDRFGNPSGTGQAIATGVLFGASLNNLDLVVSGVLAANVSARLMTNDKFIKWLGRNSLKTSNKSNLNKALKELKDVAKSEQIISDDIALYAATLSLIGVNE